MSNEDGANDPHADWLEKSISNEYLNYYEYKNFTNVEPVGSGAFGKVSRANWNGSGTIFSLKSFDDNKSTLKEVVKEVFKHVE